MTRAGVAEDRPRMAFSLRDGLAFAGFLAASYGASAIGSLFTSQGLGAWYESLQKPAWTPDGSVIGAVWTVLFFLMATAAWLVWRRGGVAAQRVPLALFVGQLALNVTWSALFFAAQSPGAALVGIVALALAILATLVAFARVSRLAGGLLVPYLAWVCFAGFLNFTIWRLNG